jgi:acetyl-CoA decarbonylase/synthase complex subunit gamma
MGYRVPPGLYAAGDPGRDAPVLVTANYKLSFDALRSGLCGLDAWILMLDTNGINVWCAAGKGTFGTAELVRRVREHGLHRVVGHRTLVVPQLGASGVQAHAVKRDTGFTVMFGPVYAADLPAFIARGMQATAGMRRVRFGLKERAVLVPMETAQTWKPLLWYVLGVLVLFGLQPQGVLFRQAVEGGWGYALLGLVAVFSGAVLAPLLLPVLPFRSFALKGAATGLLATAAVLALVPGAGDMHALLKAAAFLIFPAASSYLALNFTGATPFTGQSGVEKEVRAALPVYYAAIAAAAVLVILFKLKEWSVL